MKIGVISVILAAAFQCAFSQDCVPDGRIRPGDGIDNDCDGRVDEEYCYNGIDEDRDGRMNEDCAPLPTCERRGSTVGQEFVGAFMENRPDQWVFAPLEMIITRAKPATNAGAIMTRIRTPLFLKDDAVSGLMVNISATMGPTANAAKISIPDIARVTGARIANKGFVLRTNASVSVVGYNKELFTSDSFLQIPADALGTDYYAVTYEPSLLYTEMAIVALYSDTIVNVKLLPDLGDTDIPRIEMEWEGKTYTNGDVIRIRLQPFQVAQMQTEYDLTGTHVTSNLPIAFYSGNIRTWIRDDIAEHSVESRDHLVEQIPPTDTWGRRFVTQNYPPHKGEDRIHVVASQPDTVVEVVTISPPFPKEERYSFTLVRPGTHYQIRLRPHQRISLAASRPVMVAQLAHSQLGAEVPENERTDPSLIYIVPVTQFDNDYVFATTENVGEDKFTTYLVLTAKEGTEGSIAFDGQPLSRIIDQSIWRPVPICENPNDPESEHVRYLVGYFNVPDGVHRVRSSEDSFGAVQWAVADRNTYAHPLGMRWKKNACQICRQVIIGDGVDNDCDGQIDEEKCDGMDNDGDGLMDEDCDATIYNIKPMASLQAVCTLPCEVAFHSLQVCYGNAAILNCPVGQQITVISANYGRVNYFGEEACGFPNPLSCDAANPACPYLDAYEVIANACNGHQSCAFPITMNSLPEQMCQLMSSCAVQATYADISYLCVDVTEVTTCTFKPASRLLAPTKEFTLSASSFASCPACPASCETAQTPFFKELLGGKRRQSDYQPQCDKANFCPSQNNHCRPQMATFDRSAIEAWCPSLADKSSPWLMADLGAHYVVLGVVLQGRRRFVTQYVMEAIVFTSMDGRDFKRVATKWPLLVNQNSTQITWYYFQTTTHVARYVKIDVVSWADHPALHLEVIIDKKVSDCTPFRGPNTDKHGQSASLGFDMFVNCLGGMRTSDGQTAYSTKCKWNGRWSVEKSCS